MSQSRKILSEKDTRPSLYEIKDRPAGITPTGSVYLTGDRWGVTEFSDKDGNLYYKHQKFMHGAFLVKWYESNLRGEKNFTVGNKPKPTEEGGWITR